MSKIRHEISIWNSISAKWNRLPGTHVYVFLSLRHIFHRKKGYFCVSVNSQLQHSFLTYR